MLALYATAFGLLLGIASGGSLRNLSKLRLRWEWLVVSLFVVQGAARGRLFGIVGSQTLGLAVWIAASAILVAVLLANWRQPGLAIAAIGMALNIDVVLLNSGMPVELGWVRDLNASVVGDAIGSSLGFYHLAGNMSILTWLADAMPLHVMGHWFFYSVGDVLLVVGVLIVILRGTLGSREQDPRKLA
ncbi:MAG: DUF5317 domain-containing protein [Coriobacteriia bacterium]|nr:DUF5317 domain-containing protein [Coriobacteriia bacterium]